LTKRFGALTAVDALDLAVQRGEVFGYLRGEQLCQHATRSTAVHLGMPDMRSAAGRASE
jgi:ABC-type uncharacterized transport system ATPase subunit